MDLGCPVMFRKNVIGFVSHVPTTDDDKIFMSKTVDIKDMFPNDRVFNTALRSLRHSRQQFGRPRRNNRFS